jgi:hypothetical protein
MQRTLATVSKNRFSRSDFRPDSLTFQGCGITDRLPARPAEAYRTRFNESRTPRERAINAAVVYLKERR